MLFRKLCFGLFSLCASYTSLTSCRLQAYLCFRAAADSPSSFLLPLVCSVCFLAFFWRASSRWFPPVMSIKRVKTKTTTNQMKKLRLIMRHLTWVASSKKEVKHKLNLKKKKKEIYVSTRRIVKRKTVCYDLHDEIWRWCIAQKQPTWQRGAPEHFLNQSNSTEGIKRIRCYRGFSKFMCRIEKYILLVKTRKLRLDQNTHILFLYCVRTYRPGLRITPGQQATQSQHTYNGTLCNTC